jgi:hypothetical protein
MELAEKMANQPTPSDGNETVTTNEPGDQDTKLETLNGK